MNNSMSGPHVLATTSVGQEGLDFHPWCSHVVHWDVTSNPLDLEQREGRIQRYAGLAIRRRLSAVLREEVLRDSTKADGSLWRCVQRHAERSVDASGLSPWWVLDGAEISRHVFERPFGRDIARFAQLREQRMPKEVLERELTGRLGLSEDIRLACQLRPTGDITFRRLVLDETDLRIANQLHRGVASKSGEVKAVVLFFSDVAGFTSFSETLTPYDVMYLLNRYFAQVGELIERNDGYIDKFVGDGLMAIFGVEGQPDAPIRSVNAALQTLAAVDRMKPFFASMYGIDFDIRIGLHLGEAVIGSIGSPGHERLTAIGDAVNVASRVEAANKEAGTRLLISEALYDRVKDEVEMTDFIRVRLRGTSDRITLYEIAKLRPETERALNAVATRETIQLGGKTWHKAIRLDSLVEGEPKVLEFPSLYAVLLRKGDQIFAFNNACPHLKLPFFEQTPRATAPATSASRIDNRAVIQCRWHESRFDLASGEIVSWCEALNDTGMSPTMPMLGDISKNRAPLNVIPWREEAGDIWLALD